MYCREYSIVKQTKWEIIATPLRCKCWKCAECVPGLRRKVMREIKRGRPEKFLTLTWWTGNPENPTQAARRLIEAFRNLLRVIRYKWPEKTVEYYVVMERTKRGYPHLHVMLRAPYIPQGWLAQYMQQAINSPNVHIKDISRQANKVHYITKYLTKDNTRFDGCQRYWKSRGWLPDDDHSDDAKPEFGNPEYHMLRWTPAVIGELLSRVGLYVITEGDMVRATIPRDGPDPKTQTTLYGLRSVVKAWRKGR